jgi:hypothetical protein
VLAATVRVAPQRRYSFNVLEVSPVRIDTALFASLQDGVGGVVPLKAYSRAYEHAR